MDDLVDRLRKMASGELPVSLPDIEEAANSIEFMRQGLNEVPRWTCIPGLNAASFNRSAAGEWVKWDDVKYLHFGPSFVAYS